MSKLSFRARALDATKPLPIYNAVDLPDLSEYNTINRTVPQMPTGMEKEEETVRVSPQKRTAFLAAIFKMADVFSRRFLRPLGGFGGSNAGVFHTGSHEKWINGRKGRVLGLLLGFFAFWLLGSSV